MAEKIPKWLYDCLMSDKESAAHQAWLDRTQASIRGEPEEVVRALRYRERMLRKAAMAEKSSAGPEKPTTPTSANTCVGDER